MKRFGSVLLALVFIFSLFVGEVLARRFGPGGRMEGGFEGGNVGQREFRGNVNRQNETQYRGSWNGQGVNRSGSIQSQRGAGSTGQRLGTNPNSRLYKPSVPGNHAKPTQGQVQNFLNMQGKQGPGIGSDVLKYGTGAAAGALGIEGARRLLEGQHQNRGDGPRSGDRLGTGDRPASGEGRGLLERYGSGEIARDASSPVQKTAAQKLQADQIRGNLYNRYDHLFTPQWWRDHPQLAKKYWNETGRYQWAWNHWWRPATWGLAIGWLAGSAYGGGMYSEPIYYDYGTYIYYQNDIVYVGGRQVATADEYYQQASNLAGAVPSTPEPAAEDWLPLGVFALSHGQSTDSGAVLQLMVSKDGVIKGTYFDTRTNMARPIKGMVDKDNQRVAWSFADGKNTDLIMETGLYNLTQDQTEALVHFGRNKTEKWLMVRLQEPAREQQPQKAERGDPLR